MCRTELESRWNNSYNIVCPTAIRVLITAQKYTIYMLQLWYRPKKPATEADDEADEV